MAETNGEARLQVGTARAKSGSRDTAILVILCAAQLVLTLDIAIVSVANATIERSLGFNAGNLQWTVTAYAVTFGGFLLLGGRLADVFERKRIFIVGLAAFALSSVGAGLSQNTIELISSRAGQGICAAIVSPVLLSMLTVTFAEGRPRQRAYGVWATASSTGGFLGFVVGGTVTSLLGWRWIFFINAPIVAIAITAAFFLLPRFAARHDVARRLDIPGAVLATIALGLVIYGLGVAETDGWLAPQTLLPLCIGPALMAVFFVFERHTEYPLFPVALLRRRAAMGNLLTIFQQSLGTAMVFLAPLFMQQVWGYSAGRAGISTIPLPIGFVAGARVSSRLVARFGPRRLITIGFFLSGMGCLLIARTPNHGNYFFYLVFPMLLRSFGQGLTVVALVLTATSGARPNEQGVVASLYNMSQQLGGAFGLAVLATVASSVAAGAGGGAAGEAHGIRVAFIVALGVALTGSLVARLGLVAHKDDEHAEVEVEIAPPIGQSASQALST